MNIFFRARKYLEYQWKAKTKYYLHSPFVYQFYLNVLEGDEIPSSIKEKYGKLLFRLVKYFKPETILEPGTSVAINSSHIALANPASRIISSEAFSSSPDNFPTVDFVFFTNNQSKDATLKYFHQCVERVSENSIFVIDNIYQSEEMNGVWEEIKEHQQITLTIDVFQFGICFFRKGKLAKENFILRY